MVANSSASRKLEVSKRIQQTDVPVMVTNLKLLGGKTDVASLSQGQLASRSYLNK